MIIPVRCFSCGKVIGNLWDKYLELLLDGVDERVVLDRLGLRRYCCRQILMSHVDNIERLLDHSVPSKVAVPISNNEEEVPINDEEKVPINDEEKVPINDEEKVPSNDEEKVPSNDEEK